MGVMEFAPPLSCPSGSLWRSLFPTTTLNLHPHSPNFWRLSSPIFLIAISPLKGFSAVEHKTGDTFMLVFCIVYSVQFSQ